MRVSEKLSFLDEVSVVWFLKGEDGESSQEAQLWETVSVLRVSKQGKHWVPLKTLSWGQRKELAAVAVWKESGACWNAR